MPQIRAPFQDADRKAVAASNAAGHPAEVERELRGVAVNARRPRARVVGAQRRALTAASTAQH